MIARAALPAGRTRSPNARLLTRPPCRSPGVVPHRSASPEISWNWPSPHRLPGKALPPLAGRGPSCTFLLFLRQLGPGPVARAGASRVRATRESVCRYVARMQCRPGRWPRTSFRASVGRRNTANHPSPTGCTAGYIRQQVTTRPKQKAMRFHAGMRTDRRPQGAIASPSGFCVRLPARRTRAAPSSASAVEGWKMRFSLTPGLFVRTQPLQVRARNRRLARPRGSTSYPRPHVQARSPVSELSVAAIRRVALPA
jgi:hypothetical protein